MLKAGEIGLGDVLERADDAEEVARMRVAAVLQSLPRIGPVRAQQVMERLHIARTRRLGGLGARQREGLVERFG